MTNLSKTVKPSGFSIVFFGSGPVAAESLRLLSETFDIEAIVTKPSTAREMAANAKDARIYTVETRQELDSLINEASFESKVGLLVDFGIIVSEKVIEYFPKGIVNSHFSLLPEWRGADPITFSILSGQQKTGVSLMLLTAGMDEGPLLAQVDYQIKNDETTPSLTESLIEISGHALNNLLPLWMENSVEAMPQAKVTIAGLSKPSYSRKLSKSDGIIDWQKPASVLEREVRAFADWPKSSSKIGDIEVVMTRVHVGSESGQIGKVFASGKELGIYCGKGSLIIDTLKPAGKKDMTAESFLAGYRSRISL